jgi:hypothetical protein
MIIIISIIVTDTVAENKKNNENNTGMLVIITDPFIFLLCVDRLGTKLFLLSISPKCSSPKISPYVISSSFLSCCTLHDFGVHLGCFPLFEFCLLAP